MAGNGAIHLDRRRSRLIAVGRGRLQHFTANRRNAYSFGSISNCLKVKLARHFRDLALMTIPSDVAHWLR
jgi:hypothetical protein